MKRKYKLFGLSIDNPNALNILSIWVLILWMSSAILIDKFSGNRGTYGDMFGAVNALFSGLAFAGIIYTILLQSEELDLTRQEFKEQNLNMRKQNFETTFFSLYNASQKIASELTTPDTHAQWLEGNKAFNYLATRMIQVQAAQPADIDNIARRDIYMQTLGDTIIFMNAYMDSIDAILRFTERYATDIKRPEENNFYLSILVASLNPNQRTCIQHYINWGDRPQTFVTRFNSLINATA